MWKEENEKTTFTGGKEAYQDAARIAEQCPLFTEDCEEECVADDARSCYNCRYRRWTKESFVCMKGAGQ
ncbi:MAG: hypothetical protein IJL00_01970 [Clostridia bacterium]|nr:hypothetical protein [Clostridia bacterium]